MDGHPEPTLGDTVGTVETGDRLSRVGDLKGARAAYERAIESGHPEWAAEAAIRLGDLFAAHGARSLALTSYERAINLGGNEWAHRGWLRLAEVLVSKSGRPEKEDKDPEGAVGCVAPRHPVAATGRDDSTASVAAALKQVMDLGDPVLSARAGVTLGNLLHEVDDRDGAVTAYKRASDTDDSEWSLLGSLKVWRMLFDEDCETSAEIRELEEAVESSANQQRDEAIDASIGKLNNLLFSLREKMPTTLPRGFPSWMAVELGDALRKDGDISGAHVAYAHAINDDYGASSHFSRALTSRGNLRWRQENFAGAQADFQKAIDARHPEHASAAAVMLGSMLDRHGDLSGARAAYQYAVDSKNPYWGPQASVSLGHLLWRQGDIAAARTALEKAAISTRHDTAAEAQQLLDTLEDVTTRRP